MVTEVGYVIEVEKDGLRKLYGPVIGFSQADVKATMLRALDLDAIIRVHRLNAISDNDAETYLPAPETNTYQTTVDEQIAARVSDIHDHVG